MHGRAFAQIYTAPHHTELRATGSTYTSVIASAPPPQLSPGGATAGETQAAISPAARAGGTSPSALIAASRSFTASRAAAALAVALGLAPATAAQA